MSAGLQEVGEKLDMVGNIRRMLVVEFKAVIVLPEITRNYGNYPYSNYVGNAPVGKVITLKHKK